MSIVRFEMPQPWISVEVEDVFVDIFLEAIAIHPPNEPRNINNLFKLRSVTWSNFYR